MLRRFTNYHPVGSILSGSIWEVVGGLISISVVVFFSTAGSLIMYILPFSLIIIVVNILKGISIGILSTIIPIYIRETVPKHKLGKMLSISKCFLALGGCLSFYSGMLIQTKLKTEKSIKIAYIFQTIPIMIFLFFGLTIPESPKWLASHSRWEDVSKYLKAIENSYPKSDLTTVGSCLEKLPNNSIVEYCDYKELVNTNNKKQLLLGLVLHILIELVCFSFITNTFALVCLACGLGLQTYMIVTSFQYLIFIVFSMFPVFLLDNCRRKDSLIFGMFLSSFTLATIFIIMIKYSVKGNPNNLVLNSPFNLKFSGQIASGILALFLFLPAIYASTISSSSLLYVGELFPDKAKSKGYSLCVCASWMIHSFLSLFYPMVIKRIGPWIFLINGIFSFITGLILMSYPETFEPLKEGVAKSEFYAFRKIKSSQLKRLQKSTRTMSSKNKYYQNSSASSFNQSFDHNSSEFNKISTQVPKLFDSQFTTAKLNHADESFENKKISKKDSFESIKFDSIEKIDILDSYLPIQSQFSISNSTIEPSTRMQTAMLNFDYPHLRSSSKVKTEDSSKIAEEEEGEDVVDEFIDDSEMAMTALEQHEENQEQVLGKSVGDSLQSNKEAKELKEFENYSAMSLNHYSPQTTSALFLQPSVSSNSRKIVDRTKLKGGLFISNRFAEDSMEN
jgi:hypothetical protein